MLLSILSDTGLIILLKPPWAEILSLIGLIGQLSNKGNMGTFFDERIKSAFKFTFIFRGYFTSKASVGLHIRVNCLNWPIK